MVTLIRYSTDMANLRANAAAMADHAATYRALADEVAAINARLAALPAFGDLAPGHAIQTGLAAAAADLSAYATTMTTYGATLTTTLALYRDKANALTLPNGAAPSVLFGPPTPPRIFTAATPPTAPVPPTIAPTPTIAPPTAPPPTAPPAKKDDHQWYDDIPVLGGIIHWGQHDFEDAYKKVLQNLTDGIDAWEKGYSDTLTSIAAAVKDVPLVGGVAQVLAWSGTQSVQFEGGVLKEALGLVDGVGTMVLHPLATLQGLEAIAEHNSPIPGVPSPLKVVHNLWDVAVNGKKWDAVAHDLNPVYSMQADIGFDLTLGQAVLQPTIDSFKAGKPSEGLGRLAFNILLTFGTGGAGDAADATAQTARVADLAAGGTDAARAAEAADAAATVSKWASIGDKLGAVKGWFGDLLGTAKAFPAALSQKIGDLVDWAKELIGGRKSGLGNTLHRGEGAFLDYNTTTITTTKTLFQQMHPWTCAPASMHMVLTDLVGEDTLASMMLGESGLSQIAGTLADSAGMIDGGTTMSGVAKGLNTVFDNAGSGYIATASENLTLDQLAAATASEPAIVAIRFPQTLADGSRAIFTGGHAVVVDRVAEGVVWLRDPASGKALQMAVQDFEKIWKGKAVTITPTALP